jgi:hypothetical protein
MSSDNENKEPPKIVEQPNENEPNKNDKQDDEINVLSGDNKIDVGIKPDVKSNDVYLQLCSCSLVFNCFTKDSTAKNSD